MDTVAQHEAELTAYALDQLAEVPRLKLFGDKNPKNVNKRLGVIPLKIDTIPHFLVAAILGYEFGIGVRSGCFCAHPYILHLLELTSSEARAVRDNMVAGDKSDMPGIVRASFGLYNTFEDIDALVDALYKISIGDYTGEYIQDDSTGEFTPKGWQPNYDDYFSMSILR